MPLTIASPPVSADSADELWRPTAAGVRDSAISRFADFLSDRQLGRFRDFQTLHQFSIEQREPFWDAVWDFTGVVARDKGDRVADDSNWFPCQAQPAVRWYPGARLNFAENLLRFRDERIALVSILEDGRRQSISYGQLYRNVAGLAAALRTAGVEAGDRVAGFMPNIIETVEAMLATASLGAVWSSCSPDFGINGVLDRFGQIQPKCCSALTVTSTTENPVTPWSVCQRSPTPYPALSAWW